MQIKNALCLNTSYKSKPKRPKVYCVWEGVGLHLPAKFTLSLTFVKIKIKHSESGMNKKKKKPLHSK